MLVSVRYRVKTKEERRTYVIANPFNAVHDWHGQRSSHFVPIKIEMEDHGIQRREGRERRLINFTIYYSKGTGTGKTGWIWIESWEKAKAWADQRVGLNIGEPVAYVVSQETYPIPRI